MEILKEFLDSSTIHGLSHISNPKVRANFVWCCTFCQTSVVAKISWFITVLMGFFGASYLIGHSYHDWQKSPVLTTITTHPLDDLEFPAVTVCPPKGSNTALNYDLMQLNNSKDSLSEKKKMEQKNVKCVQKVEMLSIEACYSTKSKSCKICDSTIVWLSCNYCTVE